MEANKKKRILTLSASKIALWYNCQMAFFLRYVEHAEAKESMVLTFGRSIHSLLDQFYKKNYKSPESFAKYFKYYWFNTCSGEFLKGKKKASTKIIEYPTKREPVRIREDLNSYGKPVGEFFGYMKLGAKLLEKFYIRHKNKPAPKEREKKRTVNLFGHDTIVIFDRIDEFNGGLTIADYKTDKTCPDKDSFTLHRNPQFSIYSKAFREIFNEEEKMILYYHLRSGTVLKTFRSQKDFDYLEELLGTTKRGIEDALDKNEFIPFYGHRCKFCDYKVPCENYSVSYGGPKIAQENKIIGAEKFTSWNTPEELSELLIDE